MKYVTGAIVLVLATATICVLRFNGTTAEESNPVGPRVPVVVELFTSEGCSSCPPADELLEKLEARQPLRNAEIIALEEHVDYWNNLGWTDPFSSDASTLRQYVYAGAIGDGNAYTPQVVVDGREELVGGRERQVSEAIERAAARTKTDVSLTPKLPASDGSRAFHVEIGALRDATPGDTPEVWMAITETGLHSDVKRGENAGEDLHHAAVVRTMRKLGVSNEPGERSFSSEEIVKVERGWKPESLRFVVFVQEKKSRKILGAGSTLFAH